MTCHSGLLDVGPLSEPKFHHTHGNVSSKCWEDLSLGLAT